MSLSTDRKGRTLVLDQVNGRIVRRNADGSVDTTMPMRLRDAQDIAAAKDGSIAVLDRLADKTVAFYDESGNARGEIQLGSVDGIGDTGLITSLVVDGDDVYVEREHGSLLKIGDTSGNLARPPTELAGRPSRDGKSLLNAGITDAKVGRAWVSAIDRASDEMRFTRELRLNTMIWSIKLLDSDASGTIYLALELHQDPDVEWVLLQCLEPIQGNLIGSAELPANTLPEETLHELTVLDGGGVLYAVMTDQGVSYERYDCH